MFFQGEVIEFDPSNHSYGIVFKVAFEKLRITEGSAKVYLKLDKPNVNIHHFGQYVLDSESESYLRSRLLELIYDYNQSKVSLFHSNR